MTLVLWSDTNLASPPAPNKLIVSFPEVDDPHFRDFDRYFIELLELALEKSGVEYTFNPQPVSLFVESRSEHNIALNHYNVHWLNTSKQRENFLRPIRIPLFKGLIGWRLLFIREEEQALFAKVNSLEALQAYRAGQGHDWPDNAILMANNLPVVTSSNWESLFRMLKMKRIDYFPRSVIEIWREQRIYASLNLHIENHLALHYPAAYYFFVKKDNVELAEAIEAGLNLAVSDGSFEHVFNRNFGEMISKAELSKRKTITLKNPNFISLNRPELWLQPVPEFATQRPAEPQLQPAPNAPR